MGEKTMQITQHMHETGHIANMHLTCTNMEKDGDPKKAVYDPLKECYEKGVRNIVALRGDPPAGQEEWKAAEGGFSCALDLVKYIREQFGDYFGISVAGYPEGHPNAITEVKPDQTLSASEEARSCVVEGVTYTCLDADYIKEMDYLKEKIDAGGDFIITQMFFDPQTFLTFVKDCRKWGITCPIVPGLMCINNYKGYKKMTKFCKTRVPESLYDKMESLKDAEDKAVKAFGIEYGVEMCKTLLNSGLDILGLHFYTLNLEFVVNGILQGVGLLDVTDSNGDADAHTMQAVGSAWARVGDEVNSVYGTGTVKDIRKSGIAIIEMNRWELAGGQKPIAYLRTDSFTKC